MNGLFTTARRARGHGPAAALPLLFSFLLALPGWGTDVAAAQETGRIAGRVLDAETGAAISTARLTLAGTPIDRLSDMEGRYLLEDVPAGTHDFVVSVIGYGRKTVTGIEVEPNRTTSLDVTLTPRAIRMRDVSVSVRAERGSSVRLLSEQRRAASVREAIGSADLARSPDSDAAEAARRISGVTVAEGKYVHVRGLGERYSQTSLNGSPLPSPEPEKEVVPLDLFPADFIQSLTTQKTYTPDQPADFAGGSMQIETREFPEEFFFSASLGSSLNTKSQFARDFLSYGGGGLDFLGIDDGSRGLPRVVVEELGGLSGERLPSDPELRERVGRGFARALSSFSPSAGRTPVGSDAAFAVGDRLSLLGKDAGYLLAGTYANRFTFRPDEVERKFRTSAFDPELMAEPNVEYASTRGTQAVRWGGVANFSVLLSPRHQLSFKTLYQRNAEDEARRYVGVNREDLTGEVKGERLRFVGRDLVWGQLSGEHGLFADSRAEWRVSTARASRDEPGMRESIYLRPFGSSEDEPYLLENTGEGARYFYSELIDDDLNGELSWHLPFGTGAGSRGSLEIGGAARVRDRSFEARRFKWVFRSGTIASLDSVLATGRVVGGSPGPGEVALTEVVEPGDRYEIDDSRLSAYAMLEIAPLDPLTVVIGARVEEYGLALDSRGERLTEISSVDVLPSVNARLALTDAMNLRAAASRTVNRPEFRELAPFQFTEAASLRQLFGNPDLVPATIRSLDLRWEWFPRANEVLSAGLFVKRIEDPIEKVFIATAGTAHSFQNSEEADIRGLELTARKGLGFLGETFDPFTLRANLALIDSEVQVREGGIFEPTRLRRPLEGQSPYTASVGLQFGDDRPGTPEAGVFYSVFGERVAAAGGAGVPDIVQQARHDLELVVRQRLWNRTRLKLKASNLLDAPHRWVQSANGVTRVQREYRTGQTFSITFSYGT